MQCKFHLKAKYQIKMCISFFILNIHHIQRWKTWERLWGKKLTINKNIGTKNKINSEYFFHNLWDSLVFFSSQKMTRVEKKYQILSTNSESTFSLCCEREGHSAFPSRQHIKDKESYQIWTRATMPVWARPVSCQMRIFYQTPLCSVQPLLSLSDLYSSPKDSAICGCKRLPNFRSFRPTANK